MKIMEKFIFILLLVGEAFCFLPTKLNFTDPALSSMFCPSEMTSKGWDLKALSREGIRLEVRNLFNEDPPQGAPPTFYVPIDASLSQMFHMYYGQTASATRFYKAVNTIAWANAGVDSSESTKYETPFHFDAEKITDGQTLLNNRHNLIVSSIIIDNSYDYARQELGVSLHGIQDFYSHSTWIELGNNKIFSGLAIPGNVIDNVAGIDDQTCLNCGSPEGACAGNVIVGGKITSGFYEYDVPEASSFIVNKPEGKGKCSFGGTLDTSESRESIGGINKASTSPCFSPHYFLHDNAASLAVEATQDYMGTIRKTVGNEQFRFLLDLYEGSALCIVIDTTGSMGPELDAVKQEVALIVANTSPSLYILVPFNDPGYGPVTETTDPDEFLAAVNALNAKGGGDIPEMVWHGLQLALSVTPDYSTLYLFTDAVGKDAELMEGDIALAQAKNIIVTVIFSYSTATSQDGADFPSLGDQLSTIDDYVRLAEVTGGQFITIDKFDINSIVPIISNGLEESKVSVALRRDVVGIQNFDFPVDDSISSLEITITGATDTATLTDSTGKIYDLMDQVSLEGTVNVTITTFTDTLKNIAIASPAVGMWMFDISGTTSYTVNVDADSVLGYLVDFTDLDTRPPRPNYKLINGSPLAGKIYYVEIILVGWIDSGVTSLTSMDFIDKAGNILSHVVYNDEVDDEIYIRTEPLPQQNFYVQANGYLSTGSYFTRIFETLITPVNISVNVDALKSILAAPPNTTVAATYVIQNNGPTGTYSYFAADDQKFVTTFAPTSSVISAGGFEVVDVQFYVPPDAKIWSKSTVVVTAASADFSYDVNSAISYFLVLPKNADTVPPTCTTSDEPSCVGYTSTDTCMYGTWTVSATLQDVDSGLVSIYTQPSNSMTNITTVPATIDPGTNDFIPATVTASCCVTKLDIIGVDAQGNIGVCEYDMGTLDGVLEFIAIAVGETWVYLRWTVTEIRSDLNKYVLVTDLDLSSDIRCFDLTCFYNQTFIEPCKLHLFELTPYYNKDSSVYAGSPANTDAETLDQQPDAISNAAITYVGTNGITLIWDAPTKASCIIFYEVCYSYFATSNTSCIQTTNTQCDILNLEACTMYNISITAKTKSGLSSPSALLTTKTDEAAPGAPRNLETTLMTVDTAFLAWDAPLENAHCAAKYMYSWEAVYSKSEDSQRNWLTTGQFEASVGPLDGCTNYLFFVTTLSESNKIGGVSETTGETDETDPTPPTTVDVEPTSTTSISVDWTLGAALCVDHYLVCLTNSGELIYDCYNVTGNNFAYDGLLPCTKYYVDVAAVSPSGIKSPYITNYTSTNDEAPGSPMNLVVTDITSHSVTISFEYPDQNPQCIYAYNAKYSYITGSQFIQSTSDVKAFAGTTDTITGIDACSDILIQVQFESPQGLTSPWVSTTGTTLEDMPTAVQQLEVRTQTTTTITISWFAPQTNPKCVYEYRISWTNNAGDSRSTNYIPVTSTSQFEFDLTSLTSCSNYTITVTAMTPSGKQSPSNEIVGTTSC